MENEIENKDIKDLTPEEIVDIMTEAFIRFLKDWHSGKIEVVI